MPYMTIYITLLMFALFLWCYNTGQMDGAKIFLAFTVLGVGTYIYDSLPKSWTKSTPTSMLISIGSLVLVTIYGLIIQEVKKKK